MLTSTKKRQAVIGSAAVVLVGVLGVATPALGADARGADAQAADAHTSAGGTAPACVTRSVTNNPDGGMQAWLYNGCGKTMRVKVVVHSWRDTSCQSIPNKQSRYFRTVGGSYDRAAVC